MPSARGNQPISSGSNHNQSSYSKDKAPKRNKKLKFRKPKKTAKTVNNKQSAMINKLSKQVYKLQMSSYGKVQQNFHQLYGRPLTVSNLKPICLDLTDFTCSRGPETAGVPASYGAEIYQLVPPNIAPSSVNHWRIKPPSATYGENLYWKDQNLDQVDTGAYLAMSATYFVEVEGLPVAQNTRVRFDIISQKPDAILPAERIVAPATPLPKLLPDTLRYLQNIADPTENRINPVYFKKYMSKTIFLNSTKGNTAGSTTRGTTANKMRFSFRITPNKLCVQSETNPQVGDGVVINDNPPPVDGAQPEYPRGNFGPRNVPATQPLWLLISSDNKLDPNPLNNLVQVKLSRRVVWRDHIGSSML